MAGSQQSSFSSGTSTSRSRSGTEITPGILDVYNQLLKENLGVYSDTLGSYKTGFDAIGQQAPGIARGYGQLFENVKSTLGLGGGGWGVAAPAARAIEKTYGSLTGQQTDPVTGENVGQRTGGSNLMGLINRHLGGSHSVNFSLDRASASDAADKYANLGNYLANTAASYQSQIGQADLASRQHNLDLQAQLAGQQGATVGGFRFANTAGDLTGQYSTSDSNSTNTSNSQGTSLAGYAGGGGGGGGSGQTSTEGQTAFDYFGGPRGASNVGGFGPGLNSYSPYQGTYFPQQQNGPTGAKPNVGQTLNLGDLNDTTAGGGTLGFSDALTRALGDYIGF